MFGVGATKAGTSWLHRYLADHPECHLRAIKEMHFFDTLDQPGATAAKHQRRAEALADRAGRADVAEMPGLLANMHDHAALAEVLRSGSVQAYLDFVERGRTHQSIVGDFTPAYGLLPLEELKRLARLRPDVRFIYLMRDPVRRLWSHIRMMAARRSSNRRADPDRCLRILRRARVGREPEVTIRCDYRRTIDNLRAATGKEQVLMAFYEDLFTNEAPTQVCEFLGIRPLASDRKTLVHEGQAIDLPDDHRAQARLWLAPQYDYVANVMGRVPETWQMD